MPRKIMLPCLQCDAEVDCTGDFNENIGPYGAYETELPDVCPHCGAPADDAFYFGSIDSGREDFHSDG